MILFFNVVINALASVVNAETASFIQHVAKNVEGFLFVAMNAKKNVAKDA